LRVARWPQHCEANPLQVGARLQEYLGGDTVTLAKQGYQDVSANGDVIITPS
jgi:hypothetical protein